MGCGAGETYQQCVFCFGYSYNFAVKTRGDMTQERNCTYKRKQQADKMQAAALEMGNLPPQATDVEEAVLGP